MRKLIGIFTMLAFVIVTSMPSVSHAEMSRPAVKVAQGHQDTEGHKCHHHDKAKSAASHKAAQDDADTSGKCCDKGMCKCTTGSCHGGLVSIFDRGELFLAPNKSIGSLFAIADVLIPSAFSERLKRPPRA